MSDNIGIDSQYFMVEWDVDNATLTVVVTDDAKKNDSKHVVNCHMSTLDKKMNELAISSKASWETQTAEFSETVRDWVHNYLTTCGAFMRYSLIALFHCESRENAKIL